MDKPENAVASPLDMLNDHAQKFMTQLNVAAGAYNMVPGMTPEQRLTLLEHALSGFTTLVPALLGYIFEAEHRIAEADERNNKRLDTAIRAINEAINEMSLDSTTTPVPAEPDPVLENIRRVNKT